MNLIYRSIVVFLVLLSFQDVLSQSVGYIMPRKINRVEIPFTFQNGFIVLRVQLQGFFPLKFIFDTGAETTIITNPRIAELLDMRYTRKFPIMGSDMETILNAYLIKSVRINFNEGVAPTQDVLVFDRDHFNLEEFIGENVQGILGADVFRNYIVVIDYNAEKLVIHKNGGFVPSKKYFNIPMTLVKNKPYINVNLAINKEQTILSKLLIDSGAALTLLLDADKEKGLDLPEQTIKGTLGYGLGGELEGYMGRIASFEIQKGIRFENLITNFRVFDSNVDSLTMKVVDQKDGLIGNEILKHFKCVFDYPNKQFYMRPYHKNYNKRVAFDRSGLGLIMVGKQLQQIMVSNVFDNSPGSEAGFIKGDLIKSINGISTAFMTYTGIVNRFKNPKDKKYKVKINRQGEILTLEIRLRNLI